MSKYYLVASYYNRETKVYEKETIIDSIKKCPLNTLYNIDLITSKYHLTDLLKIIEEETNLKGFNHLAIKYVKSKNDDPRHFRIIEHDDKYHKCLVSSTKQTKSILGKKRTTNYINRTNELYRSELEKLLTILESKNYQLFLELYPEVKENKKEKKKDFPFLVKRYMNSSYDTPEAESEDLMEILVEFSRHKTFRGWYVKNLKLKNNSIKQVNNYNQNNKKKSKKDKKNISSIEDNIREYEEKFKKNYGISYDSYNTNNYNQEHEEYLSEEEYKNMLDDNSHKRH